MNGKGSKQRPTNHDAFASNYEAIFGNKAKVELFDEPVDEFDRDPPQYFTDELPES
jgi:hypothetical protein